MSKRMVHLRIKRQDGPDSTPYWEEFEVEHRPKLNVIVCLMEIRSNPVSRSGGRTTPVVFECCCLEEVCGSCSMVINGKAMQACSALVDHLEEPISLEPMSSFPIIRDLMVDRSRMFEGLKRARAWIPIDGTQFVGPGPKIPEQKRRIAYDLARCMTCGCCYEACPQTNARSDFIGPQVISQVRLFNMHPTGAWFAAERLDAICGPGGIQDCGNAQNCVEVCPKEIALTVSLADVNWQANVHAVKSFFSK